MIGELGDRQRISQKIGQWNNILEQSLKEGNTRKRTVRKANFRSVEFDRGHECLIFKLSLELFHNFTLSLKFKTLIECS